MSEVKSLNVTADTYRHRGWMWQDRATYELFKDQMKLPLWVDRVLTDSGGHDVFVVGRADGLRNTIHVGNRLHVGRVPVEFSHHRAAYDCKNTPDNYFRVIAERIRAKKPDANKMPRPQWRQPMTKPWEPATLGGAWVVDSKFVKEVNFDVALPPAWADRLWVSTSANTDTFVWVNSKAKGHGHGGELHAAKHAKGIKGHQVSGGFEPDSVVCNSGCHWQLAGVRKKTAWVPEPEVVKPAPVATAGTVTGRVASLNPLLAAPYGTDIYAKIAQELAISRNAAKVRLFRDMYTAPTRTFVFDYENMERMLLAYCTTDALSTVPKPPIGVKPRNLHDEERANALDEAMVRYLNDDLPFPIEWAVEWNELRARLNKEQK